MAGEIWGWTAKLSNSQSITSFRDVSKATHRDARKPESKTKHLVYWIENDLTHFKRSLDTTLYATSYSQAMCTNYSVNK